MNQPPFDRLIEARVRAGMPPVLTLRRKRGLPWEGNSLAGDQIGMRSAMERLFTLNFPGMWLPTEVLEWM
jgi:hypothetical protein